MGQKVNPIGLRLGIHREWDSIWYSDSASFANKLNSDIKIREFLNKELSQASVARIRIERPADNVKVIVHSARPGVIIGKKGEEIERLKKEVSKITGVPCHITIEEVKRPELDARLVGMNIAGQLEKRIMYRKAMKRSVQNAMKMGAFGVKICVSGRLGGAEIARSEWCREGRVPLHTLRADISYAVCEAHTTYGVLGVKVWIFRGEMLGDKKAGEQVTEAGAERLSPPKSPRRARGER